MLRKSSPVSFWNVCTELFSSITMTHFLTYNSVFIKYQVRAKARKCILCILCVLCISDRGTNFSIQAPQIGYWPKIGYPTRTTSLWLIQTTGGGGGNLTNYWILAKTRNRQSAQPAWTILIKETSKKILLCPQSLFFYMARDNLCVSEWK